MGKSTCLTFAVLLLLAGRPASAVKSLKLDIPKDQAIVVEVPPNQWAAKETSWTGGIPISVLRADGDFIKSISSALRRECWRANVFPWTRISGSLSKPPSSGVLGAACWLSRSIVSSRMPYRSADFESQPDGS
jgi:hypothetical protein